MKYLFQRLTAIILLFFTICSPVCAQYDSGSMDEQCREWERKAKRNLESKKSLEYADSIQRRAMRTGNRQAFLRAFHIRIWHYDTYSDPTKLHQTAEALRKIVKGREDEESTNYAFSYNIEIMHNLKWGDTEKALEYAKAMEAYASEKNSAYLQFASKRALALVHHERMDFKQVIKVLDSALELLPQARKENHRTRSSEAYSLLANAHRRLDQNTTAEEMCEAGMCDAHSHVDSLTMLTVFASILAERGDAKGFKTIYNQAKNIQRTNNVIPPLVYATQKMDAYNLMFEQNYAEAEEAAKKLKNNDRARLMREMARRKHDYAQALKYEKQYQDINDSLYNSLANSDYEHLKKQLNNDALKHAAETQNLEILKLENERKKREMLEIELKNTRDSLENKARTDKLRADSRQKATEKKQEEIERQLLAIEKEALNVERENNKSTNIVMLIWAIGTIVLLSLVFTWMMRSKEVKMKISAMTAELTKARNEAIKTNKIKDLFIKNMNHEIREPLNAVIGFAQFLGSKEIDIQEAERVQYGNLITQNAQALNMLIDDILNIADIESGKIMITPRNHRLDAIMASVLEAVEYKKHPEVTLNYTSDTDKDFTVYVDARRIQQVLVNFITLACKQTDNGVIEIHSSATENKGKMTFTVSSENGEIEDNILENLQHHTTTDTDVSTSPDPKLAMLLCQMVADKINGKIKCENMPEGGMKLTFIVPCVDRSKT